jgi:predicted small lipoprotein YifL
MSSVEQILVTAPCRALFLAASVVALLSGCGQKGALYMPAGEAAANRATLPQALKPTGVATPLVPNTPASAPAASGTAAPVHNNQ